MSFQVVLFVSHVALALALDQVTCLGIDTASSCMNTLHVFLCPFEMRRVMGSVRPCVRSSDYSIVWAMKPFDDIRTLAGKAGREDVRLTLYTSMFI